MKVLYFTATGNSLYVAKQFGGDHLSISKLMKEGIYDVEDDAIGIVVPCFHGGVPKIVEEYLSKVNLKSDYVFGVITYGAFPGAPSAHLQKIGAKNDIPFSYINELLMVDNYLPLFDMKKEMEKIPEKRIDENLRVMVQEVKNRKTYIHKNNPLMSGMRVLMDQFYNKSFEKKFEVENACNGCKTCEKVCPVDNIAVNGRPVFHNNCQHCLACTHNCPKNAIRVAKEKSDVRFKNENITLKEIIEANQ